MAFHQITDPQRLHALISAILLIEVEADLDELLSKIVEHATDLVGARYGALGVLSDDHTSLSHFITTGIDDELRAKIGAPPKGGGLLGAAIHRADILRVDNIVASKSFEGFPAHHPPMRQFLGVPVKTGDGHIYGNLYLTDRLDEQPFDEQDEQLVEAFGRAAGLVIDQAMLRDQLRELTLQQERERLARDLHDTVIQRLFGVGLTLQIALSAPLDDEVRRRVNLVIDELDTTIHEIRTTIFEIDRDDEGGPLSERVATLCGEVAERLGVTVDYQLASQLDDGIGPRCAHHTVQALREMLANVARHAQARAVRVSLAHDDQLLVLEVADDGVGFGAPIGPGRGLRNLTSRARELGGECTVESPPSRGTLVRWTANRLS